MDLDPPPLLQTCGFHSSICNCIFYFQEEKKNGRTVCCIGRRVKVKSVCDVSLSSRFLMVTNTEIDSCIFHILIIKIVYSITVY